MLPYFAVIRDSFHAALSSHVLWVAFIAIWLLLAALSPIGYREDFTTTFRGRDFDNGTRLKAMLARGLVDPASQPLPAGRLAASMPEDLRRELRSVGEGNEVRIRLSVLADALNQSLDDESWYDEEAWSSTLRFKELRDLEQLNSESLDESLRRRRARLRIEAALPGVFQTRASRSITLTYAGLDFPANLAVDKPQFVSLINQWVVPVIIDWLLGFVLVFLGILVTASIIPDMLQPGSLHLLLSKPVSRTMLLLSKFVGGCAFVFLCVIQLVVGLLLVAGLRLDVWNLRLLWCIPASVFLFAVFYSVSVVAGLRWRSPILAIAVTTIFGTICLVVGLIGGLFDGLVTRPEQIRGLTVVDDSMFAATRGGGLVRYDRATNQWIEIFESDAMSPDRILSPVALDDDTVVTARVRLGRFNPFGSGTLDLLVMAENDQWEPEPSLKLPTATTMLYDAGDGVVAMNTGALAYASHRDILEAAGQAEVDAAKRGSDLSGSAATQRTTAKSTATQRISEEPSGGDWMSKLKNMMGGVTTGFTAILPDRMAMTPPRGVVVDPEGKWLIALSRGRLVRLERPAEGATGRWKLTAELTLRGEPSKRGVLALSDDRLLVARAEDPVQILDIKEFNVIDTIKMSSSHVPVSATGMGTDGRFALVTSDGRCRIVGMDEEEGPPDLPPSYGLGRVLPVHEVESVHADRFGSRLYVVHHVDRVDVFDATELTLEEKIRPALSRWRMVDRYLIGPLRMMIPQTGELGETIAAMVSGKSAISIGDDADEEELVRYDIMRPVVSCALFITVMLTIGSVYFATRDF